jgi:hypothetical protein
MGDVHIEGGSHIQIDGGSHIQLDNGSTVEVKGDSTHPFYLDRVQNIAPVAVHLKELNHIDPINVDSLFVSQVRNIEPLQIEKFNVTNLPLVNMSLRQLPPVEMSIRQVPPISIGLHQAFEMVSNYMVRAQVIGLELFRVNLEGRTCIVPRERHRQEQESADNRSFPTVAAAGNPAIPSIHSVKNVTYTATPHCGCVSVGRGYHGVRRGGGE